MNKSGWSLLCVFLMGCQLSQVRQEQLRLVEQSDDVVLCYSLIDDRFELDENAVLKELKSREIVSCLTTIAEHECPPRMDSRPQCIDQTKLNVTAKLEAMESSGGIELLIKGAQLGIGILPF